MKWLGIVLLFIITFFITGYFGMSLYDKKYMKGKVLSESIEENQEIPSPTPTPTPTPSPSPSHRLYEPEATPTPSPVPKPTGTPSPSPSRRLSEPEASPVPQPKFSSQEIHGFMERFAGQYGVDINVLRHIAVCESGFNPSSVNGPYVGLYQFNMTAWKNNRILMGEETNPDLRFNAEEATQTAAYLISQGKKYLWPNCYP